MSRATDTRRHVPRRLDRDGGRFETVGGSTPPQRGYAMCGIIGYVGTRPALPILIEGLRRLEYRGYDSAGVALTD